MLNRVMSIIGRFMALPETALPDGPVQARLSRYDRPALSYEDLMRVDGADFVHFAVWTMCDRPVTRSEREALLALLAGGKHKVLMALLAAGGRAPSVPGLAARVTALHLRQLPLIGPVAAPLRQGLARLLAALTDNRHRRWLRRRMDRLRVRLGRAIGISRLAQLRNRSGSDRPPLPPPGLDPEAARIHDRLWRAIHAAQTPR